MGYYYRRSCERGIDVIVTTPKGIKEGGFPKGAVIPIGYLYARQDVRQYVKEAVGETAMETGCFAYTAKHCENEDVFTHFAESGVVNRFGIFLTKTEIKPGPGESKWCLDVPSGSGWFKRAVIKEIADIEQYL